MKIPLFSAETLNVPVNVVDDDSVVIKNSVGCHAVKLIIARVKSAFWYSLQSKHQNGDFKSLKLFFLFLSAIALSSVTYI